MSIQKISIIGLPMDLGQARRGVDMGPSAIRCAGIVERLERLKIEVEDLGDIVVGRPENAQKSGTNLKNLSLVAKGNIQLATRVDKIIQDGSFPLVLGETIR